MPRTTATASTRPKQNIAMRVGSALVHQAGLPGLHRLSFASAPRPIARRVGKKHVRCVLARPGQYSTFSDNPKVAVFVEPSPFSHVSGMKIRFSNLIKELRQLGSEVTVFTPCVDPPKTFCGAKVS